jgi:hypothetical protein
VLVEKGYAIAFDSGCMIVRDIPYLDSNRALQIGAIVTKLVYVDETRVTLDDHQVFFAGGPPHAIDGRPIPNLGGGDARFELSKACADVTIQRSFSNKPRPTGKFADLLEKIESYVSIISGPAIELHGATPYTFRVVEGAWSNSVFKFQDTLTSRAEIGDLSAHFQDEVVAVIGLGGTGAFLLDFLVHTPVREVRAFDPDRYYVHNTFRSPGALNPAELGGKKADIYRSRYENYRTGLRIEPKFIDASSLEEVKGVTFAFVCVDKGSSRAGIFDLLLSQHIPFIDVGMGLNRTRGPLNGMLRTTLYSAENGQAVRDMGLAELADSPNDLYRTNIQIGELNALNACIAIIRYKQLRGFYFDEAASYNLLIEIGDLKMVTAA